MKRPNRKPRAVAAVAARPAPPPAWIVAASAWALALAALAAAWARAPR
ncbi:MAG TPA: hypothetical protein VFM53_12035 [Anaeromyxobacteraceae bacterium]|nr:hypothetical protein [Anaeromyxobacteraceae bacterium]